MVFEGEEHMKRMRKKLWAIRVRGSLFKSSHMPDLYPAGRFFSSLKEAKAFINYDPGQFEDTPEIIKVFVTVEDAQWTTNR